MTSAKITIRRTETTETYQISDPVSLATSLGLNVPDGARASAAVDTYDGKVEIDKDCPLITFVEIEKERE